MPNVEGAPTSGPAAIISSDQLFDDNNNMVEYINVSTTLFKGGANPQLDVGLVQFLLVRLYNFDAPPNALIPVTSKPLSVDGDFGPITETFVKNFQSQAAIQDTINPRKFLPVRPDGVVNRAPGMSLSARLLAIYRLNFIVADQEPDLYAALLASAQSRRLSLGALKAAQFVSPGSIPVF